MDPIVTVTIVEYQSWPVNVGGAVKNPLVFQATQPIPLLDAIARAGGMREDAGSDIIVSQQFCGRKATRVTQTIPVRKLIDNADPSLNVLLHGGEEVLVPEALKIYVVGNVKKPGAYPVRNDEETTILQLLALSEGLAPYSAKIAYLYRRAPSGTKTEVPIELAKIMKRKSPDVLLQANDILYVPDNNGKRLTAETLTDSRGLAAQPLPTTLSGTKTGLCVKKRSRSRRKAQTVWSAGRSRLGLFCPRLKRKPRSMALRFPNTFGSSSVTAGSWSGSWFFPSLPQSSFPSD